MSYYNDKLVLISRIDFVSRKSEGCMNILWGQLTFSISTSVKLYWFLVHWCHNLLKGLFESVKLFLYRLCLFSRKSLKTEYTSYIAMVLDWSTFRQRMRVLDILCRTCKYIYYCKLVISIIWVWLAQRVNCVEYSNYHAHEILFKDVEQVLEFNTSCMGLTGQFQYMLNVLNGNE